MKKIVGLMANEHTKILEKIESGEPLNINDVLVAWRDERNETAIRLKDKLRFLYNRIFELQDQLKEARAQKEV